MELTIIDHIVFNPDLESIERKLKIKPGSPRAREIESLVEEAAQIARPKAMYKLVAVEVENDTQLKLDGVQFSSRILCINLGDIQRAFPYLITCGIEIFEWMNCFKDPYMGYLADTITSFTLVDARAQTMTHIKSQYGLMKTATMSPGSLEDWPLQAQLPLFNLLGDPKTAIGVTLTESLLMIPRQSVSGILFETDSDFVNCQLCPRNKCPNRRAPYDDELYTRYLPSH
jgi:hypothetical protein